MLKHTEVQAPGRISRAFYSHFEQCYYRYDADSMSMCHYVYHMLLHLEYGSRESVPSLFYSQYWMERYVGSVVGILKERDLAAASFAKNAISYESDKAYFKIPFASSATDYDNWVSEGGLMFMGKGARYEFGTDEELDGRLLRKLRHYF